MMDEVCETSDDKFKVKERTTFPCQTGWVTFDEPDKESRVIECPAEEKPSEESGRYLSLLGKLDIEAYMVWLSNFKYRKPYNLSTLSCKKR